MLKTLIRKVIYSNNFLYNIYIDFFWNFKIDKLGSFLRELSKSSNINFIQIGSNDGFSNDPLYKLIRRYKWKGVLVEPQKDIYQQLVKLHSNKEVYYENSAIGIQDEVGYIYKLSFSKARWANGLSSLDKSYLDKQLKTEYVKEHARNEGIDLNSYQGELIEKERINIISIDSLIEKYNIHSVDLIAFDIEGYEAELIPSIDFKKYNTRIILFEHRHLSKLDRKKIHDFLINYGYTIKNFNYDSIAYLPINS